MSGRTEAGIATWEMGGRYTGFSLGDSVSDVTVETDADGYVQSVTVVSDSQNGSCGYQERMTVYYAFAAAYAKWSWLYADHMRDDIIDDGWDYDAPDTKTSRRRISTDWISGTNMNTAIQIP